MSRNIQIQTSLCVGCGACMVACMDQNDALWGEGCRPAPNRRVHQVESGRYPNASIHFLSIGCMHCADPACAAGCPTGALTKDARTGAVGFRRELCIGCHSCALACPFGIPRYDREDKLLKCGMCQGRTENGLLPACVRVCQTGALQFVEIDEMQEQKESVFSRLLLRSAEQAARKEEV